MRAVADGYVYARRFACQSLVLPEVDLADDPVETGHGDIFIGMDWCADIVPSLLSWFEMQKRRGLRVMFMIYDLLPVLQPQMFPPEIEPQMRRWLDALTKIADGLVCISRTVADELLEFLRTTQRLPAPPACASGFSIWAPICAPLCRRKACRRALHLFSLAFGAARAF